MLESKSTIYRWLKQGKELGLFRRYTWRGNTLRIIMGGLTKACLASGINNWGTAAFVPLDEVLSGNGRRRIASAIATQDLQAKSHYAARNQLNKLERRCFDVPYADDLINSQTSPKLGSGGIRGVVHVSQNKIFVGKSFIPFGASQNTICTELNSQPVSCGVSRDTLQRHLDQLGIEKRQVVQAKPEYREINDRLRQGATSWKCNSRIYFGWEAGTDDSIRLSEPNGISSSSKDGGRVVRRDQFFNYYGATWVYKPNVYQVTYKLSSMKATRRKWKKIRAKQAFTPQTPQRNESADSRRLRGESANQNKVLKNENSQIPDTANNSEIPREKWEALRQKLLQQKEAQKKARAKAVSDRSLDPMNAYWQSVFDKK